jgi:hypothetical protein
MPDLQEALANWRRQMVAGGIKSPEVLDELESHLRDDVEEQMREGASALQAFEIAVQRLGPAGALECEFEKVGETKEAPERMKQVFFSLAGIPNQYMDEPMNTSSSNIEPRWATYVKSAAFLAPAVILWALSVVFLIPKLEQISAHAGGYPLPAVIRMMIALTHNGFFIFGAIVVALLLLEWRSERWPRFRRAAVGVGTFALNAVVLISIFMMVVAAVLLAPALMRPGH